MSMLPCTYLCTIVYYHLLCALHTHTHMHTHTNTSGCKHTHTHTHACINTKESSWLIHIPLTQLHYQTQVSAASSTSQSGEDFDDVEEDDGYYQDDYDVDEDDNDDMGFENEARTKETYVSPDLSACIHYNILL